MWLMREGKRQGQSIAGELHHEVIGMNRHRLEFGDD